MLPTYMFKFDLNTIQIDEFNRAENTVWRDNSKCIPIANCACPCFTTHLQLGISRNQMVKILGTPRLFSLFQKDCSTLLVSVNRDLKNTRAIDVIPVLMCIDNATNLWKVSTPDSVPYFLHHAWAIPRIDKCCTMFAGNNPNRGLHMEWIRRVRPNPYVLCKLNKLLFHLRNYKVKHNSSGCIMI